MRTVLGSLKVGLAIVLAAAPLALPGPASAAPVDEIPYAKWQRMSAVHQVKADIDMASFEGAMATYPTQDGRIQSIRVGRYLYWRIVNMFEPSAHIGGLKLNALRLVCYPERPMVFKVVRCDMRASLTVTQGGRRQILSVAFQRLKVGAWFDPAKPDYAPTVHAELKTALYRVLLAVQHGVPGLSPPSEQ